MTELEKYPDQSELSTESRRINYRVNTALDQDDIKSDLFNVCNLLVYRYSGHSLDILTNDTVPSTFEYRSLTGGITNRLFVCRYTGSINNTEVVFPPVLVRLFESHTDSVIDRTNELKVAQFISRNNAGPAILGTFLNGRLEYFLEGARSLEPSELLEPSISCGIAKAVACLHKLPHKSMNAKYRNLWSTIANWLSKARAARRHFTNDPERLALYDSLHLDALDKEISKLRYILDSLDEPDVFCHNDLLSGNIMLVPSALTAAIDGTGATAGTTEYSATTTSSSSSNPDATHITLIDFEYGSPNARAFDIANHFCECCGFDCIWENFPDTEHQKSFIRAYLRTLDRDDTSTTPTSAITQVSDNSLGTSIGTPQFEGTVENLRRRVLGYVLVAHIYWATWAVVMAVNTKISFDYLGFASLRLRGYYYMRTKCLLALVPILTHQTAQKYITQHVLGTPNQVVVTNQPQDAYNIASEYIRAGIVGWGSAGQEYHLPSIGESTGMVVTDAYVRPTSVDMEYITSKHIDVIDMQQLDQFSEQYTTKLSKIYTLINDVNQFYGITGIHVNAEQLQRTQADQISITTIEPHSSMYIEDVDEKQQWVYNRKSDMEYLKEDIQQYTELVVHAGLDAHGNVFVSDTTMLQQLQQYTLPYAIPNANIHTNYRSLIQSNIDIVIVATPPDSHYSLAKYALEHGKHVIIDKPCISNVKQLYELYTIAKSKHLFLMCYQNRRYDGDFQTLYSIVHNGNKPNSYTYTNYSSLLQNSSTLQDMMTQQITNLQTHVSKGIQSSSLGCVKWMELNFQGGIMKRDWKVLPIEQGGRKLWDLGSHTIDQALLLYKPHVPTHVYANIPDIETDEYCMVTIIFEDQSRCIVDFGGQTLLKKPRYTIVGTQGTIAWKGFDPQERTYKHGYGSCVAFDKRTTTCTCQICNVTKVGKLALARFNNNNNNNNNNTSNTHTIVTTNPNAIKPGNALDTYLDVTFVNNEDDETNKAHVAIGTCAWSDLYTDVVKHLYAPDVVLQPVDIVDTMILTSVIETAIKSAKSGQVEPITFA